MNVYEDDFAWYEQCTNAQPAEQMFQWTHVAAVWHNIGAPKTPLPEDEKNNALKVT